MSQVSGGDWSNYQGKILRINLDGSIPVDNPQLNGVRSHVFSTVIATLWARRRPEGRNLRVRARSEHDDEVNLIEAGRNYGWPNVAGYRDNKSHAELVRVQACACRSLPQGNAVPASVPTQSEMSWNNERFAPPLRTFFTVDNGFKAQGIGSSTMAPGGIDVYMSAAIPGWRTSLLALSLIRGVVYRLPLATDGRSVMNPPVELFDGQPISRYRVESGWDDVLSGDGSRGPEPRYVGCASPARESREYFEFMTGSERRV